MIPFTLTGLAAIPSAALVVPLLWLLSRATLAEFVVGDTARHARLLASSLEVTGFALAAALVVGVPAGAMLGAARFSGRRPLALLALGFMAVPPHLHAIGWSSLVAPGGVLLALRPVLYSAQGAGVVLGLALSPVVMLLLARGCQDVDRHQLEAALLARGPRGAFRAVVIPALMPWTVAAGAVIVALAAGNYGVAEHFRVHVQAVEVMARFSASGDAPAAAAAALPVTLISALIGGGALAWVVTRRPGVPGRSPDLTGWFDGPRGTVLVSVLLFLAGGVPILALLLRIESLGTLVEAGSILWPDALASSRVAVGAGLVAALAGLIMALAWHWGRPSILGGLYGGAALVGFTIPEAVLAVSQVSFLAEVDGSLTFYGKSLGLALALGLRYAPLAWAISTVSCASVGKDEEEAARVSGCGERRFLAGIVWPRIRLSVLASGFVAAAFSLGNLDVALLMTPPGISPLGVRLFNMVHYGFDSLLAAAILLVLGGTVGLAALGGWLARREAS